MKNKVFISYSSKDLSWAEKFYERLTADNFTCFWDKQSLRAGDDWEDHVLSDLQNSQHLLVLLSKDGKASDWVRREYSHFDALINSAKTTGEQHNRRIIFLLLDEDDRAFNRFQKIPDFKTAGVYPRSVDAVVNTQLWNNVINQIENAITVDPNTIPVSLAVLAMTQARFDYLYANNTDGFATNVSAALQSIGIDINNPAILAAFKQRYGNRAADWKPFGGNEQIEQILERVKVRINQHINPEGKPFRWQHIGKPFYTGTTSQARDELKKMNKDLSVFVIDPISLYDDKIVIRLGLLDDYFENEKSAIMVLTPVVPSPYCELMGLIRNAATSFFDHFFDSQVRRRYANCGVNVCDERDISRLLRATLGPHVYLSLTHPTNPYTSVG
jgi:hypothetical protein